MFDLHGPARLTSKLHFQKSKLNKRQADKDEIEIEIEGITIVVNARPIVVNVFIITLQSHDDNNNNS